MCIGKLFQVCYYHHARRSRILQRIFRQSPNSALGRNYTSCHYKAVIFDMGGVLLPSPFKLAAGECFFWGSIHLCWALNFVCFSAKWLTAWERQVLVPHQFAFFHLEWEVRNHVSPGTIRQALISGGETRPWMRFMRGELSPEAFLHEFGQQCAKIVSHFSA